MENVALCSCYIYEKLLKTGNYYFLVEDGILYETFFLSGCENKKSESKTLTIKQNF
jgi:hypothetical protein